MGDSYDKLIQDLATEHQKLQSFERILKEDTQMGDEAYKVESHLEAHKVSLFLFKVINYETRPFMQINHRLHYSCTKADIRLLA